MNCDICGSRVDEQPIEHLDGSVKVLMKCSVCGNTKMRIEQPVRVDTVVPEEPRKVKRR